MHADLHNKDIDRLFQVILDLNSVEECYELFEDLCTIRELKDMSQRMSVAFSLNEGLNYQNVQKETGVSSATIGRVNRCLEYGTGGYRKAIERYEAAGDH